MESDMNDQEKEKEEKKIKKKKMKEERDNEREKEKKKNKKRERDNERDSERKKEKKKNKKWENKEGNEKNINKENNKEKEKEKEWDKGKEQEQEHEKEHEQEHEQENEKEHEQENEKEHEQEHEQENEKDKQKIKEITDNLKECKENESIPKLTIIKLSSIVKDGDIANCKELILTERGIEECEELSQMKNLKVLDLSKNKITDLKIIDMNLNLEQVCLQHNFINNIQVLRNLSKLRFLNLSNNKIQSMEGICDLISLETLILNNNEIERVPNLSKLENLKTIILKNNKIEFFNKPTKPMIRLTKLSLGFNRIRQFHFGAHFCCVQELRLNNNKISKIEKEIIYMNSLQTLILNNNYIMESDFLNYLTEIKSLKTITVSDNPFFKKWNLQLLNQFIYNTTNLTTINFSTIPPYRKFDEFCFECSSNNGSCIHISNKYKQTKTHQNSVTAKQIKRKKRRKLVQDIYKLKFRKRKRKRNNEEIRNNKISAKETAPVN